jgi:hypothetical protein
MSDRFESRRALADKIEWEGGSLADALDYGIRVKDMPEGDEELITAWTALDEAWAEFGRRAGVVEKLLPDLDGEGE